MYSGCSCPMCRPSSNVVMSTGTNENSPRTPFKEGDRVLCKTACSGTVAGQIYTVKKGGCSLEEDRANCTCPYYWELVTEVKHNMTFMNKISIMMKKLLDSDTQVLVKAGFINGNLMPTQEGLNELDAILFIANKAELVKRANEVIAEAEAKK